MSRTPAAVLLLVTLSLSSCAGPDAGSTPPEATGAASATASAVALPPAGGRFDYQLGAAYGVEAGLDVVVRDASADPVRGAYSVCYVNGFQTQPGEEGLWAGENEELLLRDADGRLVVDPHWPDEFVLDPSTASRRERIVAVVGPVIAGCAADGFDAVEIDNLDTWTRFDDRATGLVKRADALALARAYVELAHAAGLAVGQKNAAGAARAGRDLGFDFAVVEECGAYAECGAYREVYGERVLQVEYTDNLPVSFARLCADPDRAPSTVLRDRDLVGPGDAGYTREQCDVR
ncbi:endo alpha-1,4 polygalactosaminidase [Myceligenerans salitolerans]|uniref:Endo alpha-1,4 polygalactosaminidase n=1 Tax=Myceligenerans salitolerans TaxID=1230528 RepID=A0ABS3ICH0_9MICO|nr:endo alpha-1,4 polygalactosaminidase [Myceligenerans salitolerans]MBO0610138.1 endo alpha-1,4 polygalactosaminidase [Myceligenerans salitolerans]